MSLSLSQTCQRDKVSLNKNNFDEGDQDFNQSLTRVMHEKTIENKILKRKIY